VAGQGQHLLQLSIWDLPAGLTTAVVVVVLQALAYASLAGLPVRRLCRATRRSAERPSFASWCVRTGEQVTHPDVRPAGGGGFDRADALRPALSLPLDS
jgi:hypothetical protein